MLKLLAGRAPEVLRSILPLMGVACVLQAALVRAPLAEFLQFLAGAALVVAGMILLLAGIELGILPMGRFIGAELPKKGSLWPIAAAAFALGYVTTAAEPDVLILAREVEAASQGALPALLLTQLIAAGVGAFAALGLVRIVRGVSIRVALAASYGVMIVLSLAAPERFVALAYDAGSVTTGVLSAPVLLALALGLSSVLAQRTGAAAFGLLGLASAGPVIAVLLLGWLLR